MHQQVWQSLCDVSAILKAARRNFHGSHSSPTYVRKDMALSAKNQLSIVKRVKGNHVGMDQIHVPQTCDFFVIFCEIPIDPEI